MENTEMNSNNEVSLVDTKTETSVSSDCNLGTAALLVGAGAVGGILLWKGFKIGIKWLNAKLNREDNVVDVEPDFHVEDESEVVNSEETK